MKSQDSSSESEIEDVENVGDLDQDVQNKKALKRNLDLTKKQ